MNSQAFVANADRRAAGTSAAEIILIASITSLFIPLQIDTSLLIIRPFDIGACALFVVSLSLPKDERPADTRGLVSLALFLMMHAALALKGGTANFIREALQVGIILMFGIGVHRSAASIRFRRIIAVLIGCLTAVTIFNVAWHLSDGYITGWKRLDDPKLVFTFMPLLLSLISFGAARRSPRHKFMWALFGPLTLLSGERKALLVYALLGSTNLSKGRVLPAAVVTVAACIALLSLSSFIPDKYIQRQIGSLSQVFDERETPYIVAGDINLETSSPSNLQRQFSIVVGAGFFLENPFLGVGTNMYEAMVKAHYFHLPEFMLAGIHNEFFRVVVENGIVGAIFFLAVWIISLRRMRVVLDAARNEDRLSALQARNLFVIVYTPALVSLMFEAGGTHAFVVLSLVAVAPDIARTALKQFRRADG